MFEPQTRGVCDPTVPRVLIVDGHNSHTTTKFLDHAQKHNIIVICLPPHTTHYLQPCDVALFGPLSKAWQAEVQKCYDAGLSVTRYNLIEVYARAREVAFKVDTIITAFRKTGIWPPNRYALPAEAYLTAAATSNRMNLPIPLELIGENPTPTSVDPTLPATSATSSDMSSPPTPPPSSPQSSSSDLVTDDSTTANETDSQPPSDVPPAAPHSEVNIVGFDASAEQLTRPKTLSANDINIPSTMRASAVPKPPSASAEPAEMWAALKEAINVANEMAKFIDTSIAVTKLAVEENERLRMQNQSKENRPQKRWLNTKARVLTREDQLEAIRKDEDDREKAAEEKRERAARKRGKVTGTTGSGKGRKGRKRQQDKDESEEDELVWSDGARDDDGDSTESEDDGNYIPAPTRTRRAVSQTTPLTVSETQSDSSVAALNDASPEPAGNAAGGPARVTRSATRAANALAGGTSYTTTEESNANLLVPPASLTSRSDVPSSTAALPAAPSQASVITRRLRHRPAIPEVEEIDEDDFFIRNPALHSRRRR